MQIKQKSLIRLKEILEKDYGAVLSNEETNELGDILLRLTRAANKVFARADEQSSSRARDTSLVEQSGSHAAISESAE